MTIHQLIHNGKTRIRNSGTAHLDAIVLLCHVLKIDKAQLYANPEFCPKEKDLSRYKDLVTRRAGGEPIAYIIGEKEFYGLRFRIDNRALIPRPETETLVEWVLECHPNEERLRLHDCCTGSGAIAISIQNKRKKWNVSASDISMESAELFKLNWEEIIKRSPVPWQQRDILKIQGNIIRNSIAEHTWDSTLMKEQIDDKTHTNSQEEKLCNIITANPPYLSREASIAALEEGWQEPFIALNGDQDSEDLSNRTPAGGINNPQTGGLAVIKRLITQSPEYLHPGGWLYIEIADFQIEDVFVTLHEEGFGNIEYKKDLAGMKRVVRGSLQ